MNKYIFTFGSGQLYEGYYQPIFSNDSNKARAKMVELHGTKWSHQYSEEEWKEAIKGIPMWEQPLEAIHCEE